MSELIWLSEAQMRCIEIHTRYDRCAHTFMSAICIAATIIFCINQ